MTNNLVRTTTYFDADLLVFAKKRAIDEKKHLYEIINEALQRALSRTEGKTTPLKTKH